MKDYIVVMSGIYGVVSLDKLNKKDYRNLIRWNSIYGDQIDDGYIDDYVFMGIKPEKLKNYDFASEESILHYDNKIGISDSLIYSDTEKGISDELFILKSIIKGGFNALKDINGDFAGAIWDGEKKELILYRDHIGVRPLFYYIDKSKVLFSTDIRGITSIDTIDMAIDENWIYNAITDIYAPSVTNTEYKNIKCVPPGGYIKFIISNNGISTSSERYWIPGQKKIRMKNRTSYTNELRRLIEDAVRIRANATNLRLGAELSGGMDSGVIDLLLAKMGKECFYYSWSPNKEVLPYAEDDERIVIDDICKKAGIKCNYGGLAVNFNDHRQIKDRSPLKFDEEDEKLRFIYKYAFPVYMNTIPIYETAAVMQENGVKLVFTGHSGDEGVSHRGNPFELFYHHEYYRYLRLMYSRSSVFKHRIINTVKLIAENQKKAHNELLKPIQPSEGGLSILNKKFVDDINPEPRKFLYAYDPKKYIQSGGIRRRLDVVAFYSACTGVRYIAPYVDYRLLDFALGIPRYLYFNWYYTRYIFREAFKDIMPNSLYYRRIKLSHSYDNLPENKEQEQAKTVEEAKISEKEAAIKFRKSFLQELDKDYWKKYLDFDALNNWAEMKSKPEYDEAIQRALDRCIQVRYMVKRSRELKEN